MSLLQEKKSHSVIRRPLPRANPYRQVVYGAATLDIRHRDIENTENSILRLVSRSNNSPEVSSKDKDNKRADMLVDSKDDTLLFEAEAYSCRFPLFFLQSHKQ